MRTDPSTIFARELARVDEQRARNGGDVARDERLTRPWRPLEKDTRLQARAVARERLGLAQRVNQHRPGIRITTTELQPKDAARLADSLAAALQSSQATYAA